ncbi:MAG: hypothetical protein QY323_04205 [Patescibacteria group bacterium]|nr:MAG: hypothetical protein QY323_04205 [Patescibacteria group bacterium]
MGKAIIPSKPGLLRRVGSSLSGAKQGAGKIWLGVTLGAVGTMIAPTVTMVAAGGYIVWKVGGLVLRSKK